MTDAPARTCTLAADVLRVLGDAHEPLTANDIRGRLTDYWQHETSRSPWSTHCKVRDVIARLRKRGTVIRTTGAGRGSHGRYRLVRIVTRYTIAIERDGEHCGPKCPHMAGEVCSLHRRRVTFGDGRPPLACIECDKLVGAAGLEREAAS